MIQSRPQFGYIGALLVWLFAYLQYAGFNVFNTILAGDAAATRPIARRPPSSGSSSSPSWPCVIALVGYDLIHARRAVPDLGFLVDASALLTIGVFTPCTTRPARSTSAASSATPFLVQFGVVAGYQISWAIYVSDYSRYLPPDVTVPQDVPAGRTGARALGGDLADVPRARCSPPGRARTSTRSRPQGGRRQALPRLRRDRPDLLRARPDLGHRAEHVRRLADPDQRDRLASSGCGRPLTRADRHHRLHRACSR